MSIDGGKDYYNVMNNDITFPYRFVIHLDSLPQYILSQIVAVSFRIKAQTHTYKLIHTEFHRSFKTLGFIVSIFRELLLVISNHVYVFIVFLWVCMKDFNYNDIICCR